MFHVHVNLEMHVNRVSGVTKANLFNQTDFLHLIFKFLVTSSFYNKQISQNYT